MKDVYFEFETSFKNLIGDLAEAEASRKANKVLGALHAIGRFLQTQMGDARVRRQAQDTKEIFNDAIDVLMPWAWRSDHNANRVNTELVIKARGILCSTLFPTALLYYPIDQSLIKNVILPALRFLQCDLNVETRDKDLLRFFLEPLYQMIQLDEGTNPALKSLVQAYKDKILPLLYRPLIFTGYVRKLVHYDDFGAIPVLWQIIKDRYWDRHKVELTLASDALIDDKDLMPEDPGSMAKEYLILVNRLKAAKAASRA